MTEVPEDEIQCTSFAATWTNSLYLPYPYGFKLIKIKINAACWPNHIHMARGSLRLSYFTFTEINKLFIAAFSPMMLRNCTGPTQLRVNV